MPCPGRSRLCGLGPGGPAEAVFPDSAQPARPPGLLAGLLPDGLRVGLSASGACRDHLHCSAPAGALGRAEPPGPHTPSTAEPARVKILGSVAVEEKELWGPKPRGLYFRSADTRPGKAG